MTNLGEALRRVFPECAGKTRYTDSAKALEEMEKLRARDAIEGHPERSQGMNIYDCRRCGGLHIGRAFKRARGLR